MLDYKDIDFMVREQFRIDMNCTKACEKKYRICINRRCEKKGARIYEGGSTFFRAVFYMSDAYIMADDKILEWVRNKYSLFNPAWFCKFDNLRLLDNELRKYGYEIRDTHIYFLPDENAQEFDFKCPYKLKWMNSEEIEAFREKNTFHNALAYSKTQPDRIAVAAMDDGKIAGIAGASEDGANLWQIGIDVNEDYRGKGLAVYLVTLLKKKIMELGKVPFYGTSESHTISRRVAVRSGFMPAWSEIYVKEI